jgi:hypothetical protein
VIVRISQSRVANPQVDRSERFAVVEGDGLLVRDIVEIGEKLDLYQHLRYSLIFPAPHPFGVWPKTCPIQGAFEPSRIAQTALDLQVDLNVDIGGSLVTPDGVAAQQIRHKPAKEHELRNIAVRVD